MRLIYPLQSHETKTYSYKIKDYRRLGKDDKRVLVNNFQEYYKYVFYYQNHPLPTRDQLYMAKFLSKSVNNLDPRMLQAQRGLAKSLTLQIFTTWLLLRNKNEKIVVVSATSARSESFTSFCLGLFRTIPLIKHLEPSGDDRSSTKKFDVSGRKVDDSPSMAAFGVTSAKAGSRATFIIYDDVEILENSDTAGKREKVLKGVRDTLHLGVANVYRSICICTPQSSESVYNVMVNENGYNRTIIPAIYPEDLSVYEGDIAPHIARDIRVNPKYLIGEHATDKRNNMKHLNKQRVGMTKAEFKLHYQLDTTMTDAERYPLKLSDLIVMDLDSVVAPIQIMYSSEKKHCLWDIKHRGFRGDNLFSPKYSSDDKLAEYEGIAMFIDPSGRGKDNTAYCVTAQLGGKIFLLDADGLDGGYDESTLKQLAEIAKFYKVNLIQIESNFGDGSFAELLKPILRETHNCSVEDIRATTNKFRRIIETLEPTMMQHRLVVNKSILMKDESKSTDYSLTHQITHTSLDGENLKHDDIIDCIEMGVGYWNQSLARDTKDELARFEEEQLDKELELFLSDMCDVSTSNNIMSNW